jgi:hypothetical protein
MGTQATAYLVAINVRQTNVQHDEVRDRLLDEGQRVVSPSYRSDFVALGLEVGDQHVGRVGLVFHDEDMRNSYHVPTPTLTGMYDGLVRTAYPIGSL